MHAYSRDSLNSWIQTKPASEEYKYGNFNTCLHAQYRQAMGLGLGLYRTPLGLLVGLRHFITEFLIAALYPHNFGAAHRRARFWLRV